MGILGRRRRTPPPTDGLDLLKRQMTRLDPVLRRVAAEASASSSAGGEATLANSENRYVKARRNPHVLGAQNRKAPHPHCRYCGAAFSGAWGAPQICAGCEKIRDRHELAAGEWIGDDTRYLRVHRTLANRERAAAAERVAKHGPGRLEREGPGVKMSEAVDQAKRVARAK
jgi:hypothetical protein